MKGDGVDSVIGDSQSSHFKPHVQVSRWNGEASFGVGLPVEGPPDSVETRDDAIVWRRGPQVALLYDKPDIDAFEFEIILQSRPLTNRFHFRVDGHNADFHYQPPLTPEEIEQGYERPESIVGSYAVYHNTMRDGKYKTGKIGHIFRPHARDAAGDGLWCEFNKDLNATGILTVIVPQEFLDRAVYPVTVDPTVGYNTAGASSGSITNFQHRLWWNNPITTGQAIVTGAHIHCRALGTGATNQIVISLYTKAGTVAGTTLALTSPVINLPSSVSPAQWVDVAMSGALAAGSDYILGVMAYNDVAFNLRLSYDTLTPWGVSKEKTETALVAPANLTGYTDNNNVPSCYVDYIFGGPIQIRLTRMVATSAMPKVRVRYVQKIAIRRMLATASMAPIKVSYFNWPTFPFGVYAYWGRFGSSTSPYYLQDRVLTELGRKTRVVMFSEATGLVQESGAVLPVVNQTMRLFKIKYPNTPQGISINGKVSFGWTSVNNPSVLASTVNVTNLPRFYYVSSQFIPLANAGNWWLLKDGWPSRSNPGPWTGANIAKDGVPELLVYNGPPATAKAGQPHFDITNAAMREAYAQLIKTEIYDKAFTQQGVRIKYLWLDEVTGSLAIENADNNIWIYADGEDKSAASLGPVNGRYWFDKTLNSLTNTYWQRGLDRFVERLRQLMPGIDIIFNGPSSASTAANFVGRLYQNVVGIGVDAGTAYSTYTTAIAELPKIPVSKRMGYVQVAPNAFPPVAVNAVTNFTGQELNDLALFPTTTPTWLTTEPARTNWFKWRKFAASFGAILESGAAIDRNDPFGDWPWPVDDYVDGSFGIPLEYYRGTATSPVIDVIPSMGTDILRRTFRNCSVYVHIGVTSSNRTPVVGQPVMTPYTDMVLYSQKIRLDRVVATATMPKIRVKMYPPPVRQIRLTRMVGTATMPKVRLWSKSAWPLRRAFVMYNTQSNTPTGNPRLDIIISKGSFEIVDEGRADDLKYLIDNGIPNLITLVYKSLTDSYHLEGFDQWLMANAPPGVDPENGFQHFWQDTVVQLGGQNIPIPGWQPGSPIAGATATSRSQARIPVYYANLSRRLTCFDNAAYRKYYIDSMISQFLNVAYTPGYYWKGIWFDNAYKYPLNVSIVSGGQVAEHPTRAVMNSQSWEDWAWFNGYSLLMKEFREYLSTNPPEVLGGAKTIAANTANVPYYLEQPWVDAYVTHKGSDLLFLEFESNPLVMLLGSDSPMALFNNVKAAHRAGVRVWLTGRQRTSVDPLPGTFTRDESLMNCLALFWLVRHADSYFLGYPHTWRVDNYGGVDYLGNPIPNEDEDWGLNLKLGYDVDLGGPMGDPYVIQSGNFTDYNGVSRTYKVYARQFTKGLTLVRANGGWGVYAIDATTAVTVTLPFSCIPVTIDGAQLPTVTQWSIRNGQAQIFLKVPVGPPATTTFNQMGLNYPFLRNVRSPGV